MLIRLLATALAAAAAPCLRDGPDTVQLTGRLERRTFYGPPGYGGDPRRDARETGFYLALAAPVCTVAGPGGASDDAKSGVRLVQLVLDPAGYRELRPSVGRAVVVRGTLFTAHAGHHHAPLRLDVASPARPGSVGHPARASRGPGAAR